MRNDQNATQRTVSDIDEELRDRTVRERIVAAAVRAIETASRSSWDDDEKKWLCHFCQLRWRRLSRQIWAKPKFFNKSNALWEMCQHFLQTGSGIVPFGGPRFTPAYDRSRSLATYTYLCQLNRNERVPSALQECMQRVKDAKLLLGSCHAGL